jgi:hypothetical protein
MAAAEENEFDYTITPKSKPKPSVPVNWSTKITDGSVVCLIFGHGNLDPIEWDKIMETQLNASTVLAASLGYPGYLPDAAIANMPAVINASINESKGTLASTMVQCLKDSVEHQDAEVAKFKLSTPVRSKVSNKFRNRSWDFHVDTTEGIYLYRKSKTGLKEIKLDLRSINHTKSVGVDGKKIITVFKEDLYKYIYDVCILRGWPPEVLTVDASCNGKTCKGMSSTEVRAYMSKIEGLGPKEDVVIGGTKRKHRRKSLKKKFK